MIHNEAVCLEGRKHLTYTTGGIPDYRGRGNIFKQM